MLYACVRGVMDVVFSVCMMTRGAVCGKHECFVMQILYASCVHPVAVLNTTIVYISNIVQRWHKEECALFCLFVWRVCSI